MKKLTFALVALCLAQSAHAALPFCRNFIAPDPKAVIDAGAEKRALSCLEAVPLYKQVIATLSNGKANRCGPARKLKLTLGEQQMSDELTWVVLEAVGECQVPSEDQLLDPKAKIDGHLTNVLMVLRWEGYVSADKKFGGFVLSNYDFRGFRVLETMTPE